MRGKWLLLVRRTHLYLSIFFTPILLLFVITGWFQMMNLDRSTVIMQQLARVHKGQYFPTTIPAPKGAYAFAGQVGTRNTHVNVTWPTKLFVSAMSVALLISIALGLVLGFVMVPNRIPVWISLILGVAIPVGLLAAEHYL